MSPKSWSMRLLSLSVFCWGCAVMSLFTSGLTSEFSKQQVDLPFRSLADVVNSGTHTVMVFQLGIVYNAAKVSLAPHTLTPVHFICSVCLPTNVVYCYIIFLSVPEELQIFLGANSQHIQFPLQFVFSTGEFLHFMLSLFHPSPNE